MELIALLLMIIFLGLGAAFYIFGILVVDHSTLSAQLDRTIQQSYRWVVSGESTEPQKIAQTPAQKRDLEHRQALVGAEGR